MNFVPDKEFCQYLRSKGFNEVGVRETVARIQKDRPDREDLYEIQEYKKEILSNGKR